MEATALARRTEEIAARDIGLREIPPNSNRHPRIDHALNYTGAPLGSAYCASLASLWIHEAAEDLRVESLFKKSARALGIWERNGHLRIDRDALTPADLPCLAVLDHGDGKGHVYLAVGLDQSSRKIQSIDPNSNPKGSREGGGVYALDIRSLDDEQLLGFVSIS